MELFKAQKQWAERPADERFWTLRHMIDACRHYRETAAVAKVKYADLRVEADGGEVKLVGKAGQPATLTNWAFGQVCQRAEAPASYLRDLPATLAAQNLNHGLARRAKEDPETAAQLLFHKNGSMMLRSANGLGYFRIWNHELLERLERHLPAGWKVPPARPSPMSGPNTRKATAADVLDLSARAKNAGGLVVKAGDEIAPAGLYASDHDCFVFMVNEEAGIDDGTGHQLGRGFFLWNSEVGAASLGITTFLYDAICGNHIVWGAKNVAEMRIRHVGKAADEKAFRELEIELKRYADASGKETEQRILRARTTMLGNTLDDMIEAVTGRFDVTRKAALQAHDAAAAAGRYGSPLSVWGVVNGLTEVSQQAEHADERVKLDRAAGKIMEVVF
jgi:hypothetical protein